MPDLEALPLLLGVLLGLLIALMGWGWFRLRRPIAGNAAAGARDDILLGLLVLAAFASGMFSAVILLAFVR